jgi:hypothetical protein
MEDLTQSLNMCNINQETSINYSANELVYMNLDTMNLDTMNIRYPIKCPLQSSMKVLDVTDILPHLEIFIDNKQPHFNMCIMFGQFLLFNYDIDLMTLWLTCYGYSKEDGIQLSKFFYDWCQINL